MLFIGMLFSSVLLFGAGKATMRFFSHISRIPPGLMAPIVLALCVFGIFSISNSMYDVIVLLAMGIFGFFMFLFAIPAAPFLIAFILGPMLEENLRRALALSRGDPSILVSSPITWLFASLAIFVVVVTIRQQLKKAKV